MTLSRRNFLQGAAVGLGGAALVGLAGCAPASPTEGSGGGASDADAAASGSDNVPKNITNTIDCDICIVGAGFSGMVSAVQAAMDGADVVVLEASNTTGGASANGVEGSFGANSKIAKEQGIVVDINEILNSEMDQSQWRADGLSWYEMMVNSGDNIDWLMEQGVRIDKVDDYHGKDFQTFHWYEGGIKAGYIDPLTARMEELGVRIEFSTPASELVTDASGKVTGVLAESKSGEWTQVNAGAVILATGGFGANYELCSNIGYPADRILSVGSPYDNGSGHDMAVAVGAHDMSDYAADNCGSIIRSIGFDMGNLGFCMKPQIPWINDSCERFYREDNCLVNLSLANPPKWNQRRSFMIWDQAIQDGITAEMEGFADLLERGLAANEGDFYKADSLADLAKAVGLDADELQAFVDEYNAMCAEGVDLIWGKNPEYMVALGSAPYYIAEPINAMFTTIGGVATNRQAQAIDKQHNPIEGLYVVGVEGCMLYRNVYTIGTPGSCSGNSINTARVAVKHAMGS